MPKKNEFAAMDLLTVLDKKKDKSDKIELSRIKVNKLQPRILNRDKIEDLCESISKLGLIEPIVVRRDQEESNKFIIVAGERRYHSVSFLGWKEIPAIIIDTDEDTSYEIALAENEKRKNLNPWEIGRAIRFLREERGKTADEVSKILGYTPRYIKQLSSIARLEQKDVEDYLTLGGEASVKSLEMLLKRKEISNSEIVSPQTKIPPRVSLNLSKLNEEQKKSFMEELVLLKNKYGLK